MIREYIVGIMVVIVDFSVTQDDYNVFPEKGIEIFFLCIVSKLKF